MTYTYNFFRKCIFNVFKYSFSKNMRGVNKKRAELLHQTKKAGKGKDAEENEEEIASGKR